MWSNFAMLISPLGGFCVFFKKIIFFVIILVSAEEMHIFFHLNLEINSYSHPIYLGWGNGMGIDFHFAF
jgi:hypothetical protein